MNILSSLLQPELELVRQRLNKEISIRGQQLPGFGWPALKQIDQDFLPSLVLLSSRGQGYFGPRAVYLATVLQFIFLASLTHNNFKQQLAPGILLGDYFYTCSFNILCRDENFEFLEPLSKLICDINLDAAKLLRNKKQRTGNPVDGKHLDKLSTREYLAVAATNLGSQLGQASPKEALIWQEIGQFLGKLWNKEKATVRAIRAVERIAPGSIKDALGELVMQLNMKRPFKRVIAL